MMRCLLVYDIPGDNDRLKVSEACLDYGLDRIQYSAFFGDISSILQEELMLRVDAILEGQPGKVFLFPVCDEDWKKHIRIDQE
jgi:CRISPR-associated protein Cas2